MRTWTRLNAYMEELCKSRVSGCACLVYADGKEQYRHYAGKANMETGEAPDCDTLYRIYSLTKLYTAVAALQLAEQGRLDLNARVSSILPEYESLYVNHVAGNGWNHVKRAENPLRISHLLTMRSGISYAYDNQGPTMRQTREAVARFRREHKDYTTQAYGRLFAKIPLAFEPGTHFLYGAGYDVLAAALEVVSGETLGEYMRRHIWEPLELENTMFRLRKEADKGRLCGMYTCGEDGRMRPVLDRDDFYQPGAHFEEGGGGVLSTLDDYMRFQQCLLDGGSWNGRRILSENSVRQMRTNALTPEQTEEFLIPGYGYGCGVRVRIRREGTTPEGEFGWYGSSGSYGLIDPVNRLCFLYMQQMIPGGEGTIHSELRRRLYEDFSEN